MQPAPLVSFVLVNWRTEEYLPDALESIRRQTHHEREVILVDNASEGFDASDFGRYQPFTLIPNLRNYGFAAANNQGIAEARGDFIVLLNCDASIEPDFTARALAVFAANPRIGIVVPKLLAMDHSGRIDSAGHVMYSDRTTAHRGRGEKDQGQYDRAGFVFGGTAAAVVYRREMIEQIAGRDGLFDESFFAYFEDVDVDWRANLAGWLAYYEPRCLGHHLGHGSGGRSSLRVQMLAEKNRYLMLLKNDTLRSQLSALGPLLLHEAWHFARTLLKPWLWPAYLLLLLYLPRALAYRFSAERNESPAVVASRFAPRGPQPPPAFSPPDPRFATEQGRDAALEKIGLPDTYPLVSVIVVNYNGLQLSKLCIEALLAQSYPEIEIIFVDNGSAADEADLLAMQFPTLRTLHLPANTGFTGGVNWGASLAQGDYIALVNNDCICDPDCIRNLIYSAKREEADAVSGRLVNISSLSELIPALNALEMEKEAREDVIWDISAELERAIAESHRNHGVSLFGFVVEDAYAAGGCFYPSGGLCLLKRSALQGLLPQLFPHSYFAYHEDVQLGMALRVRGLKIIKEPRAAGVHIEGSTARRLPPLRLRMLQERNRWLNIVGYYPAEVFWKLWPFISPLYLSACLLALFTAPGRFLSLTSAHLWLLTHPAALLRWRAWCRSDIRVADEQWLSELSGQVRGKGGWLNGLALKYCRAMRIVHREDKGRDQVSGIRD